MVIRNHGTNQMTLQLDPGLSKKFRSLRRVTAQVVYQHGLDRCAIAAEAARALDIDPSLVSRILRKERGITPQVAERIERLSEGRFAKERFIWPEPAEPRSEAA